MAYLSVDEQKEAIIGPASVERTEAIPHVSQRQTVHAVTADGTQVAYHHGERKWYAWAGGQKRMVRQPEAVRLASQPDAVVFFGRPAGRIFDNRVREARGTFMDSAVAERFWAKVDRRGPDECWPWLGQQSQNGHGHMRVCGSTVGAHRISLRLEGIVIPDGHVVHHRCENPSCVNPDHLEVMTPTDHTRHHCLKGCRKHGEEDMTPLRPGKNRWCRICDQAKHQRRRDERAAREGITA